MATERRSGGRIPAGVVGRLLLVLAAAAPAALHAQEKPTAFVELEKAADALPVAEQIEAYRELRRKLMAEAPGEAAAHEHLRLRVERKLSLAIRRRATADPPATEIRVMAREAAGIGMLYLKEDNPEAAVAYEQVIDKIESPSPARGLLRNATRDWFRERLRDLVDRQAWKDARDHVSRWESVLGSDPSVSEGKTAYASRRTARILEDLGSAKAERALGLLADEEKSLPGQPEWETARAAVRQGLIKDIERSALETKPDQMRQGIARFEGLYPGDERLSVLMANYDELVEKTLPSPITREYGMVKNVALRVGLMALLGSADAETSEGDEVTEDSGNYIGYKVEYHRLSRNEKGRITESGRWLGGRVSGAFVQIKDEDSDDTAELLIARPEMLIGWRGRQWNAVLGVGLTIDDYVYDGAAYKLDGTALSYASLSAGFERGIGKHFSVYADAHYAGVSELQCIDVAAGLRYFPSPNFSIDVGYMWSSADITPEDSSDPDIEFGLNAAIVGISLQF